MQGSQGVVRGALMYRGLKVFVVLGFDAGFVGASCRVHAEDMALSRVNDGVKLRIECRAFSILRGVLLRADSWA